MMKVRLSYAAQDNFRRPRIFLVIFLVLLILGLMGASGRLKALSHRLSTPLHFLDGRVEATLWLQKRGRLSSPAVGGFGAQQRAARHMIEPAYNISNGFDCRLMNLLTSPDYRGVT
jgi:hypothetical protein